MLKNGSYSSFFYWRLIWACFTVILTVLKDGKSWGSIKARWK